MGKFVSVANGATALPSDRAEGTWPGHYMTYGRAPVSENHKLLGWGALLLFVV